MLLPSGCLIRFSLFLLLGLHVPADDLHQHGDADVGKVAFPISCSAATQQAIERGLALQHSFWFDPAEKEFADAAVKDPGCAMAYWAEAMGLYRPLAYRPSPDDMKRGSELIQKAQSVPAKTQRERDYIAALAVFYRNNNRDYETRNREYSEALEKIYRQYPEDREAAVFYAMSLLTWGPDEAHPLINPQKAIAILTPVFRENPNHPGVAHYLIHAADSPQLAPLGLEAARRYAQIAPAAPHALHMPSHIFARLGLWQEDIRSNLSSLEAARHPAGEPVGAENQLHAMEFLEYAYLQMGDDVKAEAMVRAQAAIGYDQVDKNLVDYLNRTRANSPAMYDLETRHWKEALALQPDPTAEPNNQAVTYWARAVAAGHLHDVAAVQDAVHHYDEMLEATRLGPHAFRADYMTTKHDEAHVWLDFVQGRNEEAIRLLRAVAEKQDVEGKGEVESPAREMLADMLLEMRHTQEALTEYEQSLKIDPNRFNGLYGAGRASELAHHAGKAKSYYAALLKNCGDQSDRPELARAKEFLTR